MYSREVHNALEGVKDKTEQGKFMVLSEDVTEHYREGTEGEEPAGGHTIGGDVSFYEWDYESNTQQKDQ